MKTTALELARDYRRRELRGRFVHRATGEVYRDGRKIEHPTEEGFHFMNEYTGRREYMGLEDLALLDEE